jgi:hypothetical protein
MKEKPVLRIEDKNQNLCKLYSKIGEFAKRMDYLSDAGQVKKEKKKPVPISVTPMVF